MILSTNGVSCRVIESFFPVNKVENWVPLHWYIFLEIYNERIHDLLDDNNSYSSSEDTSESTRTKSCEGKISSTAEAIVLAKAMARRSVGQTAMNSKSSRSHAVYDVDRIYFWPEQRDQSVLKVSGWFWIRKAKTPTQPADWERLRRSTSHFCIG